MTWLERLAKIEVIENYIAWIIFGLCIVTFLLYLLSSSISWYYKKHSKKYKWNYIRNCWERKDEDE